MKTLREVLREADPLDHEPRSTPHERGISRQTILAAPPAVERSSQRTIRIATIIALALLPIVAIGSQWLRVSVNVEAAVRFEVRLAEENPTDTLREAAVSDSGRKIYLHQEVIVGNGDIARAEVVQADATKFEITVAFTAEGAQKMSRATRDHVGRPLAILIDGKVVMAPVVRSPIGGSAVIDGNYTRAEAERIVAGILGR